MLVKWDILDPPDLQANRVYKDHEEQADVMVSQDRQDYRDHRDQEDLLDTMVTPALLDHQDQEEPPEHQDTVRCALELVPHQLKQEATCMMRRLGNCLQPSLEACKILLTDFTFPTEQKKHQPEIVLTCTTRKSLMKLEQNLKMVFT